MKNPVKNSIVRHVVTGELIRILFVAEDHTLYGERVFPVSEHDCVATAIDRMIPA